jgi:hypothetical protein
MFSYRLLRVVRATWKELADASRERLDVRDVEFRPPRGCALPRGFTSVGIGQALAFRSF